MYSDVQDVCAGVGVRERACREGEEIGGGVEGEDEDEVGRVR